MPRHKFKLRPSVQYVPDKLQATTPAGAYKITRLLPSAGRDQQYRLKSALEPSERIAEESQLTLG